MKTLPSLAFFLLTVAAPAVVVADDAGRIRIGSDTTPGRPNASYVIDQPGSYYLAGNLLGEPGKHAIQILASGVTLDLNGFAVIGAGDQTTGGSGVWVFAPDGGPVVIRNGTVRNWRSDGVTLFRGSGLIEALMLTDNSGNGFTMQDSSVARIERCIAQGNDGSGFANMTASNASIVESTAEYNVVHGFLRMSGRECGAFYNGQHGFSGGMAVHCETRGNHQDGYNAVAVVEQCSAFLNGRHGIFARAGARVADNTAASNGRGNGILDGSGIWVDESDAVISGNRCSGNDRGMTVRGTRNRVEDNHLTDNAAFGLWVGGQYNIIIRNTARNLGGMNWSIAQFNRAGAFVAPPAGPAIMGNTGGPGSGTTDPFANLSF